MKVRTILNRTAAATAFAASLVFASACAHNSTANNDYGHIAQNQPAAATSVENTTPIPGPAKVDNSGNVYTSSAAPGSGNASGTGTNTNVSVMASKTTSSSVAYTDTTPVATVAPVSTPVVETTPPVATTTETTAVPMTSSSTQEETKTATHHHRRMRKD
jgi:hypothetical protein